MTINETAIACYQNAVNKGFWNDRNTDDVHSSLSEMALIHSEVSEATEAIRSGDFDNLKEELADICIRVFDSAAARGINLEEAIRAKMARNAKRPYMHGRKA